VSRAAALRADPRYAGGVEAISRNHGGDKIKADYRRIAERRGRNIGRVAAARKVLRLVCYGLRDGEIRCLTPAETG
jgi:hypothetical protein